MTQPLVNSIFILLFRLFDILVYDKFNLLSPSRERGQLLLEGNTLLPEDIGMQV